MRQTTRVAQEVRLTKPDTELVRRFTTGGSGTYRSNKRGRCCSGNINSAIGRPTVFRWLELDSQFRFAIPWEDEFQLFVNRKGKSSIFGFFPGTLGFTFCAAQVFSKGFVMYSQINTGTNLPSLPIDREFS